MEIVDKAKVYDKVIRQSKPMKKYHVRASYFFLGSPP